MSAPVQARCGECARFVRVIESIDENGVVRRVGECLLGVWPSPLYATSTCDRFVQRGTFMLARPSPPRAATTQRSSGSRGPATSRPTHVHHPVAIPEEILDMTPEEFRAVLTDVIREEFGSREVALGARWEGGEMILKPGKEGTQDKRVPIETFFHKIVMLRDRLRVLEQRINAHPKLSDEEKVNMQQYITQTYGTLTSFNVLFAEKSDGFTGQKADD